MFDVVQEQYYCVEQVVPPLRKKQDERDRGAESVAYSRYIDKGVFVHDLVMWGVGDALVDAHICLIACYRSTGGNLYNRTHRVRYLVCWES